MLEKVQKSLGFIPNLIAIFANNPTALEGYLALGGVFEKSFLFSEREADHSASRQLREQLQLLRICPFSNCEKPSHAPRGYRSSS